MRLFFVLLALSLISFTLANKKHSSSSSDKNNNEDTQNDWVEVSSDEYDTPLIEDLLNYGAEKIVKRAIKAGKIPKDSTWEVEQLNNAWRQEDGNTEHYKFDAVIDAHASNEDFSIAATFNVKSKSDKKSFGESSYDVKVVDNERAEGDDEEEEEEFVVEEEEGTQDNNNNNDSEWVKVSSEEYESDLIQDLVSYGGQWVVDKAAAEERIPVDSAWTADEIVSVWENVKKHSTLYKLSLALGVISENRTYDINTTVRIEVKSDKMNLKHYSYRVRRGDDVVTEEDAEEGDGENEWEEVSSEEFESALIQDVLAYGSEWVIKDAKEAKDLPKKSSWEVENVNEVLTTEDEDGAYYQVDVALKAKNGRRRYAVDATFEVRLGSDDEKEVVSSDYEVKRWTKRVHNKH